jgi:peptidoglycan hydrolase-like protein with peptidoglycan-binding domain
MEFQQALADRGYYTGPVNGTWGPDSIEALKRFQQDQNLTPDGKLGSLSIIALGLGPKRDPATTLSVKPASPPE